jgi:hypothetical protein
VPLQNRVTPLGEIIADPARGHVYGNRGCLHGADRRLGAARWRTKAWICCVLDWKGVQREPMPVGRWTALFFLDEATALAAGHRPCAYCRRSHFLAFAEAWATAEGQAVRPRAAEIDARLHAERVDPRSRRKLTWPGAAGRLPDGVMILHEGVPGLLADGRVRPWSFDGYGDPVPVGERVELLTPPATVAAIAAGYRPMLHPSALLSPSPGCEPRRI